MDALLSPQGLISLLTLTGMEIVLGIDNIIFIAILVAKVPIEQQRSARTLGISLALITRLMLLFSISWVMQLTTPLFTLGSWSVSGRDLILIVGGTFLMGKATLEIHEKVEQGGGSTHEDAAPPVRRNLLVTLAQIMVLDIVFSLDSVITAVGMASHVTIMVVAMVTAVGVMLLSARAIGDFVERHPTIKVLALSFLLLIGVVLVAEGLRAHVDKGYIYFAMAFSLAVEAINMRVRRSEQARKPGASKPA